MKITVSLHMALWLCSLGCVAFNSAGAATLTTVTTSEGEELRGRLEEFSAQSLTVNGKTLPLSAVAQIRFSDSARVPASTLPSVILRNTDVLTQATIVAGSDTRLTVKTAALGEISFENKAIDAIVYNGPAKKMPSELEAFLAAAPPKEDSLLNLKGEQSPGFFEKIDAKAVTFSSGGQSRAYPFEQLAALRFALLEKFESDKAADAVVRLADGSRLSARIKEASTERLKVASLHGEVWEMALSAVASIELGSNRFTYLSALNPSEIDEKPLVGGSPVIFTWRRDRSSANTPMKIGARSYEKGIGMHAESRLAFELKGAYSRFIAEAGLDVSAAPKASCAWKILLDGKEAAAGIAKTETGVQTIKLDVSNAQKLELICEDTSDSDGVGARMDFGVARLIRR